MGGRLRTGSCSPCLPCRAAGATGSSARRPPCPTARLWQPESLEEPRGRRPHPPRVLPAPPLSLSIPVLCSTAWGARGPTVGAQGAGDTPRPAPGAWGARDNPAAGTAGVQSQRCPCADPSNKQPLDQPMGTGGLRRPLPWNHRHREPAASPCRHPKGQAVPHVPVHRPQEAAPPRLHPPPCSPLPPQPGTTAVAQGSGPNPSSPQPHGGTMSPRHAQGVGRGIAPPAQHPRGLAAPPRPQPQAYSSLRRRVECTE